LLKQKPQNKSPANQFFVSMQEMVRDSPIEITTNVRENQDERKEDEIVLDGNEQESNQEFVEVTVTITRRSFTIEG
jgi:mevalonate pyrophosphate decarboxylase